ncbi:MAG: hydroxymethylglutaryl-CoA reductase [Gammaproteobacteria bacterium]
MSNDSHGSDLESPPESRAAPERPSPRRLPATTDASRGAMQGRHARLREDGYCIDQLAGEGPEIAPEKLAGSIEGFVGFARVPLGVAGPVRIHGAAARGDFFVPLATSEGTLVASFQHAFNAINRSGGANALCTHEEVGRAPCFEFADLHEAAAFTAWLVPKLPALQDIVAAGSRHCRLRSLHTSTVGNTVYVLFSFSTGDAAGQNMVTSATQAICEQLLKDTPRAPRSWLVESGLSGDKKASPMAFRSARGRNASAEVTLPAKQVERYWRAEASGMARTWSQAVGGTAQTGSVSLQGNVANALAALFIACGQDVACVAEASTALTRIERTPGGDVYASVTLPNLIVGTVGGGTYLPTARECLAMLGCEGPGQARKFAEVCAVVALAGEIAVVGVMAGSNFAGAHASGGARRRAADGGSSQ